MEYDDWHAETQERLAKSFIYREFKEKCDKDTAGYQALHLVDDATTFAYQKTKTILKHMGEFTLHDGDHLFRVLILMERLLGPIKIKELSAPELMLLILSAFFHDIGMAPEEKSVLSWKKVWDKAPSFDNEDDKKEFNDFKKYYSARPEQISMIDNFTKLGNNSAADLTKSYIISDYIRATHATRAREIINKHWLDKIVYRDTDLTVEFASICFSHNEDPFAVLDLDQSYLCGPEIYANLQLVAVILRLSDLLDFDAKRTPSVLYSHLFVRHPISIKEWGKHRAIEAWAINSEKIQYHAKCEHPAIEASIKAFCDLIDKELSACNNIITKVNEYEKGIGKEALIKIPFKVDRSKIETKKDIYGNPKYLYRETKFSLSKTQVIDLLMGTKLYGNPEVALRELLQNSIDACLLRSSLEASWGQQYTPEIIVRYSTVNDEDALEVIDNGIGMDQYIIDSYYSKIGSSFYKSPEFYELKLQSNSRFTPTSRFGIGILSCFMVADTLIVDTRRVYGPHNSCDPINLTIEGQESIFWITSGKRKIPGTSTKLILRKNHNPWDRMDEGDFIKSAENVIPNPPFKITIESKSHKSVKDENSFKEIKVESFKENHTWEEHANIRELNIELGSLEKGFVGSAIIGVLESHGEPASVMYMTSKSVEINGKSYELNKNMSMHNNEIDIRSTSITIDEDGEIEESDSSHTLCESNARLSLHGIEVPTTLFPSFWNAKRNQVKISWPFPIIMVIDVCGARDLDLNSSRSEIIMSEKWIDFEESILADIFSRIPDEVSKNYWDKLKAVLNESSKNQIFLNALDKAI